MSRAVLASLLALSLAVGFRDTHAPARVAVAAVSADVSGEAVATLSAPGLL